MEWLGISGRRPPTVRIFGILAQTDVHWSKDGDGIRKLRCSGPGCPKCAEGERAAARWIPGVLNRSDGKPKLMEIGAQLMTHLKEMNLAAAGLAHETRNPLNIIRGLAQMISRETAVPEELRRKSREIVDETDRVTAQLNEFINFSRPREVRRSRVALATVVTEVVRALNFDLEEKRVRLRVTGEAAEEAFRTAIDVLRGIAGSERWGDDLASALADYGMFLTDRGRFEEGREVFEEGLEATTDPSRRAVLYDRLGILLSRSGTGAEAEEAYRRGIELREAAAEEDPTFDRGYPLVESYNNLGMLYAMTGKAAEAERLFPKGKELIVELRPERPDDPVVRSAAAASHGNLAGALVLLGRFDEAAAEYASELATREALAREHPRVLDYQLQLASAYTNLGELDVRVGKPAEGLPRFDRAIATLEALLAVEPKQETTASKAEPSDRALHYPKVTSFRVTKIRRKLSISMMFPEKA